MTKEDYILITRALASVRPDVEKLLEYRVWYDTCFAVCKALAQANGVFQPSRFMVACCQGEKS